jgi:hypothetical protein
VTRWFVIPLAALAACGRASALVGSRLARVLLAVLAACGRASALVGSRLARVLLAVPTACGRASALMGARIARVLLAVLAAGARASALVGARIARVLLAVLAAGARASALVGSRLAPADFAMVLLAVLAACSGRSSAPVGSRIAPALAAALAAADDAREPWRCGAPDGPSVTEETLAVGARTWLLGSGVMRLEAEGKIAIGVIADAAGSAPATLAALGRLRAGFEHVDLVLSLGGMGATRAELEAVFAALTDRATWPLVALPGDLEPAAAQVEAIAAARRRGSAVIDGRLVQRIELPVATIALLPGVGAASRLVAGGDGCSYRPEDVAAMFAALTPREGLRIVASADAPRHEIDGEPSGDRGIAAGAGQQIDVALHGPTGEAATPARNGHRDGSAAALTPGSSDAMPRLPGPRRSPTAGVLTVQGNAWSWKPIADVN